MTNDAPLGERFSLVYLRPEEEQSDSRRLRKRLTKLFEAAVEHEDVYNFGNLLERELGIDVLRYNGSFFIPWGAMCEWELRDVLCTITMVERYVHTRELRLGHRPGTLSSAEYKSEVARIFSQERAAYRLDEKGGVHPSVDVAYRAGVAAAIRGLGGQDLGAVRSYIEKADENLLPIGDRRTAVRSAFDAAEETFKLIFRRATKLDKSTITQYLRPLLERSQESRAARQAALSSCDALQGWASACHNYRHAEGEPEPAPPPEELAVALVSQGMSHVRWLLDIRRTYSEG